MCIKAGICVSCIELSVCVSYPTIHTPGLSAPVCATGPSSTMRLTRICPVTFFMVHPIPISGSFTSVTCFRPVSMYGGVTEGGGGNMKVEY